MRFGKKFGFAIGASLLLLLGACGQTDIERAATGAIIGGAAAAVTNNDVGKGALIGGAAGASCRSARAC